MAAGPVSARPNVRACSPSIVCGGVSFRTLLAVALACGLFAGALTVPSGGRAGTAKPCKHGFVKKHGRCVTVPKPKPAPPPVAQDGHYVGTTSDVTPISFDVSLAGTRLTNFTTGQINVSCTPFVPLQGGGYSGGGGSIAADGSFLFVAPSFDAGTINGFPAVGHSSIQGVISPSGSASGTLNEGFSFGPYVCDSGLVTWTAALTP